MVEEPLPAHLARLRAAKCEALAHSYEARAEQEADARRKRVLSERAANHVWLCDRFLAQAVSLELEEP